MKANKKILTEVETEHNLFEVKIKLTDLTFSKDEIIRSLGYKINQFPEHFTSILDGILSCLDDYCEIKAGYKTVSIRKSNDLKTGLFIEDFFFDMDKIITNQLKNAYKGNIFVCTIGPGMEEWSRNILNHGDVVKSFFIDTSASAIVESVADLIHDHIGQKAISEGMNFTNRYSPGYCNWHVSEQRKLFSLLPDKFCGITLNASAMMTPIKSISGIIGIGEKVKMQDYFCDNCGMKDCTYRQIRIDREGAKK